MKYIPSMKWIVKDTEPKLREKCVDLKFPISNEEQQFVEKMRLYVDESYNDNSSKYDIRPGIGIAAPQVGLNKRLFYIHLEDNGIEYKYFLANPKFIKKSPKMAFLSSGEGCLSVENDHEGYVLRNSEVEIEGYEIDLNKTVRVKGKGLFGMCIQHEMDHLDGKLYYDRINPFDRFPEKYLQENEIIKRN